MIREGNGMILVKEINDLLFGEVVVKWFGILFRLLWFVFLKVEFCFCYCFGFKRVGIGKGFLEYGW